MVAQVAPQIIAFPRREPLATPRLSSSGVGAWLPLASILVGIITLFYLAQTSELTTTGYSIQELKIQESNWKQRNEQLGLELARARSLAAVDAEATGRLLMARPKTTVYLEAPPLDSTRRLSSSSRGESRGTPEMGKAASPDGGNILDPVRTSISTFLAPRSLLIQR